MPLLIINGDITKVQCDAIVNAANSTLLGGGGVDGAIHAAAGPELLAECKTLGGCRTGEAKLTGAYRLPAKFVIHTVGPVWRGGMFGEKRALQSCYRSALELAKRQHCESVAFPLISAGAYGYPKEKALAAATRSIAEFLKKNDMLVYLVIYDRSAFEIGKKRFQSLQSVIDETYIPPAGDAFADTVPDAVFSPETLPSDSTVLIDGDSATVVPSMDEPGDANAPSALRMPAFCRRCGYRMRGDTFYCPCCGAEMERPPEAAVSSPAFSQGVREGRRPDAPAEALPLPEARADFSREKAASPNGAARPNIVKKGSQKSVFHAALQVAAEEESAPENNGYAGTLEDALGILDESFSEMLLRKIDERGITDVACYKRANIDRKLFSKIRGDRLYKPKKTTALAFAVALELTPAETRELLMKAGYALSRSSKFDIIVDYYISRGVYDIFEINEALFAFDQPLLS